jgi:UDPglucose 6-dehydrogenase
MKITVIGTGYVGLVSGTCFAEAGHEVVCVDVNEDKIAKLNDGIVPIFEPGLAELVQRNHAIGRLSFTTSLKNADSSNAIFFALPTPPGGDGQADLSFVIKVAEDIAPIIKEYTVFVNKSTVPVGTVQRVRDVIAARTDVSFDVVSNPEFLREGFAVQDFMNPDRIVIGTSSDRARKVLEDVYRPFILSGAQFIAMDEASSEMTKYAANSFLAMKISFMNEIANLCELVGANVDNVRLGIGADERIGRRFLNAGIGYGGSCFPKDVMALEMIARLNDYDFKILKAVMEVNEKQKHILVDKIVNYYGENLSDKTFAVWGLAFKPDTDDIREAPSMKIIQELLKKGANITTYDPQAMDNVRAILGTSVTFTDSAEDALRGADASLIVTEWEEFSTVKLETFVKNLKDKVVFDCRNIFDGERMKNAGLTYFSIGRNEQIGGE